MDNTLWQNISKMASKDKIPFSWERFNENFEFVENPFPGLHYTSWGTLAEHHEYINGIEIKPEHRSDLQKKGKESIYYEYYNKDKSVPDTNN